MDGRDEERATTDTRPVEVLTMDVRTARPDDRLAVRRVLDAAMLEPGDVEARLAAGDVLVAVDGGVVGALVLEPHEDGRGAHVASVAVGRRRRDRGIGTALVEAALDREGRLTAHFDERVAPFYDSLGFDAERIDEERYRGVKTADE